MMRLVDLDAKRRIESRHKRGLIISLAAAALILGLAATTPFFWTAQQPMEWMWWALAASGILPLSSAIVSIRRLHAHRILLSSPQEARADDPIDFDEAWRERSG